MPRKICFIITSFIHYSRNLLILEELNKREDVELHVIIGGAALLPKYFSKYADLRKILAEEGMQNIHEIYFNLEGSETVTKAKTAGLGIIEFATIFSKIKPDLVVVRGDRFEVLSAALAAAYMNVPIAHIEGGDLTGTIDESVRHAISKLSHVHFATNDDSRERLITMGEHPEFVFNYGSPEIEVVERLLAENNNGQVDFDITGSGASIDLNEKYLMVMYHPVTTEIEQIPERTRALLQAVHETDLPVIWFWPNFDAGAEEISHELRFFKDKTPDHKIKFMRLLPPKKFLSLLIKASCFVGNSSAGIKECSYLGIPVVNIGSRQNQRLRSENVVDAQHDKAEILESIKKQLAVGRYPKSDLYHVDNTSAKIAETLAIIDLYIQKSFFKK